jgi:protein-tyrosine phosphatase
MDEVMARLLAEHGVDSVHFRSHQLTRPEVDRAALVLTMTTQHRSQVVQLAHHALNKTFTLLEFSALTKATRSSASNLVGAERVRQAVTTAASLRSEGRIMVEVQDIDDPYRRRHSVYRHVFEQVVSAMEPIADALAPHPE